LRTRRELWKHQVATHRLSHLKHRLPLINDKTGVCSIPTVTAQWSKEQTTSTVHYIVVCHTWCCRIALVKRDCPPYKLLQRWAGRHELGSCFEGRKFQQERGLLAGYNSNSRCQGNAHCDGAKWSLERGILILVRIGRKVGCGETC
jgi:hypothetical protein